MIVTPPEVDRWISAEFTRLAEIIQDYSHSISEQLELRWIPPEMRETKEEKAKPYCIYDARRKHVVMFASELDNPKDILAKLFDIDNKNGDLLQKLRARNAAAQAFQMKEQMDKWEEARDFSAFVIGNQKSRWKHNGQWYDDEFRRL